MNMTPRCDKTPRCDVSTVATLAQLVEQRIRNA